MGKAPVNHSFPQLHPHLYTNEQSQRQTSDFPLDANQIPAHSCYFAFLIWRALSPFEDIKIITDSLQMRDVRTRTPS